MLAIVFVGEFKDGFFHLSREPGDGLADEAWVPVNRGEEPGRLEPGEFRRRGPVDRDFRVGMLLQEAPGHVRRDRALHRLGDDPGFMLAESDEDEPSSR